MWRIIKFIFTGSWHEHKWKIHHQGTIYNEQDQPTGHFYDLQCEICGVLKRQNHGSD